MTWSHILLPVDNVGYWIPGYLTHSSVVDHSQTLRCHNIIIDYKTSIKPISEGKHALLTLVVYIHHLWLSKKSSLSDMAKNLVGKIIPCLFDVVYQCIVALDMV